MKYKMIETIIIEQLNELESRKNKIMNELMQINEDIEITKKYLEYKKKNCKFLIMKIVNFQ